MLRDRGVLSEKLQLKALIREAAQGSPTMTEFLTRLQTRGVQVRPNLARTNDVAPQLERLASAGVAASQLGSAVDRLERCVQNWNERFAKTEEVWLRSAEEGPAKFAKSVNLLISLVDRAGIEPATS